MIGLMNNFFHKRHPEFPDNTRLLALLYNYRKKKGDGKSYERVALELMHGNCFLLLPTRELAQTGATGWRLSAPGEKLNLASIYTVDGQQVLASFTDEQALLDWSRKPCPYVSLKGQWVLEICESNDFSKLVINSRSENTFVLERRQQTIEQYAVKKGTMKQIGTPGTPLDPDVIARLVDYFKSTEDIQEVYCYGQTVKQQFSLVLGFKLQNLNPGIEAGVVAAVQASIGSNQPSYPLDVQFFDPVEDYELVKAVENALIYRKS
jgi:hypothetical protein